MGRDPNLATRGGVYRPRNARASAFFQCANCHMKELRSEGRLQRLIEERVIERFLECGDPHHGFARIYCTYGRNTCPIPNVTMSS